MTAITVRGITAIDMKGKKTDMGKLTYLELLQLIKANKAPSKVRYGNVTYVFNEHEYDPAGGTRVALGEVLGASWTSRAHTTAEVIEVVADHE